MDLYLCLTSGLREFTLKEVSERTKLIRKLKSDWVLAREKKKKKKKVTSEFSHLQDIFVLER